MRTQTPESEQVDLHIQAFILKFCLDHGYSPTVREVADAIGLSVPSTHRRLFLLRGEGHITFQNDSPRTLRVVPSTGDE